MDQTIGNYINDQVEVRVDVLNFSGLTALFNCTQFKKKPSHNYFPDKANSFATVSRTSSSRWTIFFRHGW